MNTRMENSVRTVPKEEPLKSFREGGEAHRVLCNQRNQRHRERRKTDKVWSDNRKLKGKIHRLKVRACWDYPDYLKALEEQKGVCAIGCGRPIRDADHDDEAKKPRQLLCGQCNKSLGLLQESPTVIRSLADYIETWNNKLRAEKDDKKVSGRTMTSE